MELIRKQLEGTRRSGRSSLAITLDEDRNVPDALPDLGQIILSRGMVETEPCRSTGEKITLAGKLKVFLLYNSEGNEICHLAVSLPFTDSLVMAGAGDSDQKLTDWVLDDLKVEMIHSRKIRVRAVILVTVTAEAGTTQQWVADVVGEEPLEKRFRTVTMTEPVAHRKEIYRIQETMELHGSQPEIQEILWTDTRSGRVEVRPDRGKITLRGELQGFLLYRSPGDGVPLPWYECTIPFEGSIQVSECTEEMIAHMDVKLIHSDWDVREDADGERRCLTLEAILEVNFSLFRENSVQMLEDVYSPARETVLQEEDLENEHILLQNRSSCRLSETISTKQEEILQICYGMGDVLLDEIHMEDQGLLVDGALHLWILYVSHQDLGCLRSVHGTLPVHYLAEAAGIREGDEYSVRPQLETLNFIMSGRGEIEVRASIGFEILVRRKEKVRRITDLQLVPYEPEKIRAQADLVGYCTQEGDTLWKLARKFYTTVDRIRQVNPDLQGEPEPGTWLLMMKQSEELDFLVP